MDKNKPSVPHFDTNLKNNPEINDNEMHLNIKKTIDKNNEIIEKNREMLRKYKNIHLLDLLMF